MLSAGSGPQDICTSATENFSGDKRVPPPDFNIAFDEKTPALPPV
jgi:hypothetical protein